MTSWEVPEFADVERTLSAVGEPALRSLFFGGLENPEWLAPLTVLGVFADPGVVETDDGVRPWPWPEGVYLRRVAADHPVAVGEVLMSLTGSANPWVVQALVDITGELPIDSMKPLVPGVAAIIRGGASRVDVTRFAVIVERLLDAGERKAARKLLDALFGPLEAEQEEMAFGTRTGISSSIDDYWYKELLVRLTPRIAALGMEGVKLTTGWLMRAGQIRSTDGRSLTMGVRRPSIAPSNQNAGLYDIDDALVDLVRDVATSVTRELGTREAVDFLNGRGDFVVRRVGVEVVASTAAEGPGEILEAGLEMLRDASLLEMSARPEYSRLAEALAPTMTNGQRGEWQEFLQSGEWLPPADRLRRLAAWPDRDPEAVSQSEIEVERQRLLHRLLSGFSGALTGGLAQTFEELEGRFGQVAHPRFASYIESFTGPTSPLSGAELAAMPAADISSLLRTWTPDDPRGFGPSVEGLGRSLEEVVAADPTRFEPIVMEFSGLRPVYVRSIVSGWSTALVSGHRLRVETLAALAQLSIEARPDDASDGAVDYDDDHRWVQVDEALVRFATSVADTAETGEQLEAAWRILAPLTSHSDPSPDHESKYGGSNMDPLTLSLNTVRPSALRGAMHVLSGVSRLGTTAGADLKLEVLATLAAHAGPALDGSLAVAAAFGEGIGRIWNADEAWVVSRMDSFARAVVSPTKAAREWADVVVSVSLRCYSPGGQTLKMLKPAIEAMLSVEYTEFEHVDGWRETHSAVESAADHLIWCVAQGVISLHDPLVVTLFSGATAAETLSVSLGHHGWQLMHILNGAEEDADPIPPEFLERSRALVEWRLKEARAGRGKYEELSQFHWWIKSGAFTVHWWLPILDEVTAAGVILDRTFIGEPLAEAAASDPGRTVRVFDRLISAGEYWQRYDLMQHAGVVVSAALRSEDGEARGLGRLLLDRFAREGQFDVVDHIDRLSNPGSV